MPTATSSSMASAKGPTSASALRAPATATMATDGSTSSHSGKEPEQGDAWPSKVHPPLEINGLHKCTYSLFPNVDGADCLINMIKDSGGHVVTYNPCRGGKGSHTIVFLNMFSSVAPTWLEKGNNEFLVPPDLYNPFFFKKYLKTGDKTNLNDFLLTRSSYVDANATEVMWGRESWCDYALIEPPVQPMMLKDIPAFTRKGKDSKIVRDLGLPTKSNWYGQNDNEKENVNNQDQAERGPKAKVTKPSPPPLPQVATKPEPIVKFVKAVSGPPKPTEIEGVGADADVTEPLRRRLDLDLDLRLSSDSSDDEDEPPTLRLSKLQHVAQAQVAGTGKGKIQNPNPNNPPRPTHVDNSEIDLLSIPDSISVDDNDDDDDDGQSVGIEDSEEEEGQENQDGTHNKNKKAVNAKRKSKSGASAANVRAGQKQPQGQSDDGAVAGPSTGTGTGKPTTTKTKSSIITIEKGKSDRREFSYRENQAICDLILENGWGKRVSGMKLWKEIVDSGSLDKFWGGTKRNPYSLQTHFLRIIAKDLEDRKGPRKFRAEKENLKKYLSHRAEAARTPHAQHFN